MINSTFFQDKIETFGGVADFAKAIGLSRQAIYDWLKGVSTPEPFRLLSIADILNLAEHEVEILLNIPRTELFFRKTGLGAPSKDVQSKSLDLAETFFKIDGSPYVTRDSTLFGTASADTQAIASYIRKLLSIEADEPVQMGEVLLELRKHNIVVSFLPFEKLGLSFGKKTTREVAFSARKGNRVLIFVDTRRTLDEALFDICHELAHLICTRNEPAEADNEEQLCNLVAQELIYPERFLRLQRKSLMPFTDTSKFNWNVAVTSFFALERDFHWSPKGLALALQKHLLIGGNSHELKRLMHLHKITREKRKSLDQVLYSSFNPEDFVSIKKFFDEELERNSEIYRPFIELRDAATSGRLSSRKFAELLNVDSGDADELVRTWNKQREDIEAQDENVGTQ